jgi:HD-GYP domain-containing protein (c-di-GMP phosphodiesterase class II)
MSDIYDKFKDDNKDERPKDRLQPREGQPPEEPARSDKISFSYASNKSGAPMQAISEKAIELYNELYQFARRMYSTKTVKDPQAISGLDGVINKIIDALDTDSRSLMKLCLDDYPRIEEYFYYHIINVTVLSLELAKGLNYERKALVEIGVAAFLHDVGLIKYENVIETSKALTKMEYDTIKNHPTAGLEELGHLGNSITQTMRNVISQEHERLDGSGYPEGLKGSQIAEQAQVVGLIDVYEALTHQRPYLNKHKIEAIKSILGMKNAFDSKLVKVLIERVGIFPVGVFVRLSTKEIGIVVENNPKLPFRPIINIMFDTEGRRLKDPKVVNLADNSVIFIEECAETPPPGN